MERAQPWIIRLTHWLNLPALLLLLASGLQIWVAYPRLGPCGTSWSWFPLQGWVPPAWTRAGDWLAGARHIHFAFAWLLVANGFVYVFYAFASGQFRRRLFWPPRDAGHAIRTALFYMRLRKSPPEPRFYNGLQRLAYTSALLLGVLLVLSGLAIYKPVQLAWLCRLLGGYDVARALHFVAMAAIVLFTVGHVVMVALHPRSFVEMITGRRHA